MISHSALADLCVGLYAYDGKKIEWDHYDDGANSDGVCWALADRGDYAVVVLRGSTTREDWRRDFDAWADPFHHDDLGPVHPGFLSGMRTVQREIVELAPAKPLVITGHSLGAARASILSALLTFEGRQILARVVFGEPRPGFAQLAYILSMTTGASYRNTGGARHDLITDVPFSFPPEEYVHPTPLIDVSEIPDKGISDSWGIFALHHMPLYAAALQKLGV
jgi:Lipase (class 3)